MIRRIVVALGLLSVAAWGAGFDRYGGWTAVTGKKTGFFHTQEVNGRWWLITPEGNGLFSKGVCHITARPEAPSSPAPPANRSQWVAETITQLRSWNFNTAGAWSDPEFERAEFVFAPVIDVASSMRRDLWLKGGVVDYFSKEFRDTATRVAKQKCKPQAANPWLLGYFTDNELRWGPDWRSKESLLESYLRMDASTPGRQKAAALLASRGHNAENITEDDKAAFLELAAAEYARVSREAIRRYDANHMVIGCRFAGYAPEPVLRGVGPHFDIISHNTYDPVAPTQLLKRLTEITGKPTMVTEFSFKAMDSGLPNTKGAAKPVAKQQERADGFAGFVEALADLPGCVGFHWFQYRDQPKEGRRLDGENSNYGVVRLDGTPWEVLTARMKAVNATLEERAAGAR